MGVTALAPSRVAAAGCVPLHDLRELRGEHLEMLNRLRKRNEVATLDQSAVLDQVALDYACLLAETGHFDHTGPDGSTLMSRVTAGGYEWCLVAENLAKGQQSLLEAMKGWIKSPGHWKNLKRNGPTEIGFGAAYLPREGTPRGVGVAGDRPARGSLTDLAISLGADIEPLPEKPDARPFQPYVWVQVFGKPMSACR